MLVLRLYVVAILIAFAFVYEGQAQWETGYRPMYKKEAIQSGEWPDSTTLRHHKPVPILTTIPPVSTDMPLDVLISYLVIDSILKTKERFEICDYIDSLAANSDTLKRAWKYSYKIVDYDPLRWVQYENSTAFLTHKRRPNTVPAIIINNLGDTLKWDYHDTVHVNIESKRKYKSSVRGVTRSETIREKMRSYSDSNAARLRWWALAAANILGINVLRIDSIYDKRYPPSPDTTFEYRATCQVLEIFKGKRWPAVTSAGSAILERISGSQPQTYPLVQFRYHKFNSNIHFINVGRPEYDTMLVKDSDFGLYAGLNGIAMLTYSGGLDDNYYDYVDLTLDTGLGNCLRIENEMVCDPAKLWNNKTVYTLNEFREAFQKIVQELENGSY